MRTAWYIAAMLSMGAIASAALYPEPSGWGMLEGGASLADRRAEIDTMAMIASKMPEGFGPQLRVRLIDDRIGRSTQLIALRQTGTQYHIAAAWSDHWLTTSPKAHLSRCSVAIDGKMAETIIAAWKGVLLATSYGEKPAFGGSDSTQHYAMSLGGRWLAGWAYAPEADSAPGRLHTVAQAMLTLCQHDDAAERAALQTALTAFH